MNIPQLSEGAAKPAQINELLPDIVICSYQNNSIKVLIIREVRKINENTYEYIGKLREIGIKGNVVNLGTWIPGKFRILNNTISEYFIIDSVDIMVQMAVNLVKANFKA